MNHGLKLINESIERYNEKITYLELYTSDTESMCIVRRYKQILDELIDAHMAIVTVCGE